MRLDCTYRLNILTICSNEYMDPRSITWEALWERKRRAWMDLAQLEGVHKALRGLERRKMKQCTAGLRQGGETCDMTERQGANAALIRRASYSITTRTDKVSELLLRGALLSVLCHTIPVMVHLRDRVTLHGVTPHARCERPGDGTPPAMARTAQSPCFGPQVNITYDHQNRSELVHVKSGRSLSSIGPRRDLSTSPTALRRAAHPQLAQRMADEATLRKRLQSILGWDDIVVDCVIQALRDASNPGA